MLWVAFWGAPLVVSLLGLTTCPSALIFDSPCPGCGLTRSVKALLSGDWETALQLHPLGPFVAPALALLFGGYAAHYLRTGSSSMPRRVQGLLLVIVASLFVVWVARHAGAFGGPVPVGLNGT